MPLGDLAAVTSFLRPEMLCAEVRPAATMVEVSAFIAPQLLVEIEADAYLTPSGRPSGPVT